MELAIANSAAYCPPEILVRWLSGRKQRFAKAPYLSKGTEGSNPSLTAISLNRMITETSARAKVLETVRPLPARNLSILQALDHFAAEDYFARLPLPMFDNSAMDGYAVVARDCKSGSRLRVVGEQPAGLDRQLRISKGNAIRIFTGAPMPAGADAVVMQEDVTRNGDGIVVNTNVEVDEFVRKGGG